ncbi:MAG TPA: hypothetical protein PLU52_06075 [Opitutaceae bacterium]|nr:hypothetical protein [Opitutaceae bacterium]
MIVAIVTSQRQASSEEIVAEMDRRGLVIQQLEELRDRLCDDIKTLRDDVEMEKRVREEWRQRCEWAEQRAEAVEKVLREIIACTHRPNPTDRSRIDIAPGQHRRFQAAIEAAIAKHAGGNNG